MRPIARLLTLLAAPLLLWSPVPEANTERITAAALSNWPPQYRTENGQPAGFAIAVMEAVAERAGVAVDYRVYQNWSQAHRAMRRGEVDVIPNMGITPDRKEFARFTVPVETFPVVWFVRAASTVTALEGLRGRRVGVVEANVAQPLLAETRDLRLRTFASLEQAVFALMNGEIDALVYPEPVVAKLLRESGLADRVRVVGDPLVEIRRGIAVRRDLPGLHERLNRAADGFVGSEAYRRLYTRWYGEPEPWLTAGRVGWTMGGVLAVAVLALLGWRYLTMLRFSRRLQQEMAGRRQAEAAQRLAARAMDEAAEGVVITDADGRIRQVNQAFTRITGFEAEEVEGRRLADLQEGFPDIPEEAVAGTGHWRGEVSARRRDGEAFPAWQTVSAVRDELGATSHFVVVFNDISDIKASQEELDRLAHRDALTGLPNRLLFTERLEQALRRARRQGGGVAVLFLDLDGFKHVNDAFGHYVGDELLQAVADRLREGARETDTLARMGGDEFILLVEGLDQAEDAAVVAQKILKRLALPFELHGHDLSVEGSIGISLFPEHGTDVPTLIKSADAAMYRAKSSGRNGYRFFSPELTETAAERVQLQEALAHALDQGELCLAYQPVVALDGGAITGVEASVRLPHPQRGLLEAEAFMDAVQGTQLMARLADWILAEACRQTAEWQRAGREPGRVVVRVAGAQLSRTDLAATVERVLADTGLEAGRLELDLPEAAIAGQAESFQATLHRIRDLGVAWVLADFGSSTCSLGMLRELPLSGLKVATRFVRSAPAGERDRQVVEAVVALGRNLGLGIAANGVETAEQLDTVRAAGFGEAQGPYLHPRLTADEAAALLAGPGSGPPG